MCVCVHVLVIMEELYKAHVSGVQSVHVSTCRKIHTTVHANQYYLHTDERC